MTIKKIVAVIALIGVFMIGGAFANEEFGARNKDFNQSRGYHQHNQAREKMMELTGLNQEELEEYRQNHCLEDGISMIDMLKEKGLYEQWESGILADFQEKLDFRVENNRLTQAEADQAMDEIKTQLEEGPPYNFGSRLNHNRGFKARSHRANCIR